MQEELIALGNIDKHISLKKILLPRGRVRHISNFYKKIIGKKLKKKVNNEHKFSWKNFKN